MCLPKVMHMQEKKLFPPSSEKKLGRNTGLLDLALSFWYVGYVNIPKTNQQYLFFARNGLNILCELIKLYFMCFIFKGERWNKN